MEHSNRCILGISSGSNVQLASCGPPQSQAPKTIMGNAPGPAQHAPEGSSANSVSLTRIRALVRSALRKGSVRGQRVFRRNAGIVCGLAREVCGSAALLWTESAWNGALETAMSGLEGLIDVPESSLLEGFRQAVASSAAAHLEGLKQQGREGSPVQRRVQARKSRGQSADCGGQSNRNKQPETGLDHADQHSLECCACGATADYGLRGGKEGGAIKYFCRVHATSNGYFRIDPDRAVWAHERVLRQLKARVARLEEELQQMGGNSSAADPAPVQNNFQSEGHWATMPMSRSLIATLLKIGCVECNPGLGPDEGTPDKVAQIRKSWKEACTAINPRLLDLLASEDVTLAAWRGLPPGEHLSTVETLANAYERKWLVGWTTFLMRVAITLPKSGGIEFSSGPGPDEVTPDEIAHVRKSWEEAGNTIHPTLLEHLATQTVSLADWRELSLGVRIKVIEALGKAYEGKWPLGWTIYLKGFAAPVGGGQAAEAGHSTDLDMQDADQGSRKRRPHPLQTEITTLKLWTEVENQLNAQRDLAVSNLARCFQDGPEHYVAKGETDKSDFITGLRLLGRRDQPLLLLADLPSDEKSREVLTKAAVLRDWCRKNVPSVDPVPITVLFGVSGAGKTRTCLEFGCFQPGTIYLTADPNAGIGIRDMRDMMTRLNEDCRPSSDEWAANLHRARRHVYALLYARLTLLEHCVKTGGAGQPWLYYRTAVVYSAQEDVLSNLYLAVRNVEPDDLLPRVVELLKSCRRGLKIARIPIIIDEAQLLSAALENCFSNNPSGLGEGRPLLTALVHILNEAPLTGQIILILAGTGLSMLQRDYIASASSKSGAPKPETFVDFGEFEESQAVDYLTRYAGSEETIDALPLVKEALGRRRFVAGPLQRWLHENGRRPLKAVFKEEIF
ncbi:hypothetical protein KFL_000380150 [Klebsormidium nitens]|uniref:Uncharacterized protein n=1 Tax=Klebsormidium nitens TaxID=105231 RepID=A0A1Y1HS20_KLENI|nr:hypothetical protein KFL_000380150 [Klebsormidium nitens]|eukprot:GAQ79781.1 hypothetical protein KFL_000380150 [Klebsormidium nitens]